LDDVWVLGEEMAPWEWAEVVVCGDKGTAGLGSLEALQDGDNVSSDSTSSFLTDKSSAACCVVLVVAQDEGWP
jgi:hypothetical protein